ncbi:hypothetical protein GRI62_03270 [Erythrobacter arachoides]|uniref:Glutathione S-transferase n=1 Tax=Aurantiacibacter arachoides TaxID=1850444 RepID=A0A845A0G0_9SPHN|nr:glutathione S-transferase family protein [Aurantiacibacter arachoides]MXO92626.1 hypothetical protein [Aurantiacibacter arachoides]GGD55650.1 hypothetical protein GCM10011411_14610 [Aurantiacibacter arachoides]
MADLLLYHAHTACTRVTLTALEATGEAYEDRMLDFRAGENRRPDYLALSPGGKVPCLLANGEHLTENVAILRWLHAEYPDAGLFPPAADAWDEAQQMSALSWIASGWHPSVRAVKVPFLWTKSDTGPVRERGEELVTALCDQLDSDLEQRRWWFGNDWSIVDTYLWWAYTNSEFGGFDLSLWRYIARHRADHEALPQLRRALAREDAAHEKMEAARA